MMTITGRPSGGCESVLVFIGRRSHDNILHRLRIVTIIRLHHQSELHLLTVISRCSLDTKRKIADFTGYGGEIPPLSFHLTTTFTIDESAQRVTPDKVAIHNGMARTIYKIGINNTLTTILTILV